MSDARRILIVDDEPNVRLMFRTALESVGYLVAEAGDGESGLAVLHAGAFDVLLLDLRMPVLDGMGTLRRMRDEHLSLPTIIITAHGSVPDAVEAMKLGAIDFVAKPVTPDALRAAVGEVIARHRTDPEPTAPPPTDLDRAKREINRFEFETAAALLAKAGNIDDMDAVEAHYLKGLLLQLRGQPAAALAAYRAAVDADPTYEPARAQLAKLGAGDGVPS